MKKIMLLSTGFAIGSAICCLAGVHDASTALSLWVGATSGAIAYKLTE